MVSRLATSIGTSSRSVTDPVMSGIRPHLASITDSDASGLAKRKSAASASCSPPPKQCPCTTAITGTGSSRQAQQTCWKKFVDCPGSLTKLRRVASGPAWPTALKSSPAQNESPAPVRTTARTSWSRAMRFGTSTSACIIGRSSPLSLSARLSVT